MDKLDEKFQLAKPKLIFKKSPGFNSYHDTIRFEAM
jgi:hypothetical protein